MSEAIKKEHSIKTLVAGFFGNILEWYDFVLYGYFAPVISQLFFPSEDKIASLIATFGVFAAGYMMRPLGALIFGTIGDKIGRKKALVLSIFLMAIPTTLIGVLPTYAQVGILAPILLIVIRLFQGISVGGEFPSATSYLVESAKKKNRVFAGSWSNFGSNAGILLASGLCALITSLINHADLLSWGWRLGFLFGAVIGITGVMLRKDLKEPEHFQSLKESGELSKSPVKEAFKYQWKNMLVVIFSNWLFCTSFYMIFVYMTTFMSEEVKIPLSESLDINTFCMVLMLVLMPLFAILADKHGRKPYLVGSCLAFIVLSIPLFYILSPGHTLLNLLAYIIFAVIATALQSIVPVVNAEIFPTKVRMSAMSFSYNVSQAIFGGTTPLVATFLIANTGIKMMPAFYLTFCAIVSLVFYLKMKEPDDLEDMVNV